MRHNRTWKTAELDRLLEMEQQGLPQKVIALELGRTTPAIHTASYTLQRLLTDPLDQLAKSEWCYRRQPGFIRFARAKRQQLAQSTTTSSSPGATQDELLDQLDDLFQALKTTIVNVVVETVAVKTVESRNQKEAEIAELKAKLARQEEEYSQEVADLRVVVEAAKQDNLRTQIQKSLALNSLSGNHTRE